MVFTFPRKVFLVKALDKKLKLFFIFFLEVGERVLTTFKDVIQGFQLVVLVFRGRLGFLLVLAACERMLLRLLPIGSVNLFGLLLHMQLYGSSWYRWVGTGRCKEREVLRPINMPLLIIEAGLILILRTALFEDVLNQGDGVADSSFVSNCGIVFEKALLLEFEKLSGLKNGLLGFEHHAVLHLGLVPALNGPSSLVLSLYFGILVEADVIG